MLEDGRGGWFWNGNSGVRGRKGRNSAGEIATILDGEDIRKKWRLED